MTYDECPSDETLIEASKVLAKEGIKFDPVRRKFSIQKGSDVGKLLMRVDAILYENGIECFFGPENQSDESENVSENESENVIKKRHPKIRKIHRQHMYEFWVNPDYKYTCCYCCKEKVVYMNTDFHYMHVDIYGNNSPENGRPGCAKCNIAMGDTHMDIFMRDTWGWNMKERDELYLWVRDNINDQDEAYNILRENKKPDEYVVNDTHLKNWISISKKLEKFIKYNKRLPQETDFNDDERKLRKWYGKNRNKKFEKFSDIKNKIMERIKDLIEEKI